MSSFTLDKETVQDMVATYGKEYTLEQLSRATHAWLEELLTEVE